MNNCESINCIIEMVNTRLGKDCIEAKTFAHCYPDALRTIHETASGNLHVITGDIPAMWLRDSVPQFRPYLLPAKEDKELADMLVGLSHQQFFFINQDPYANAFNAEPNNAHYSDEDGEMGPFVWERKFEIDSLCYPLQLAYLIYKELGRVDHLDDTFFLGAERILEVFETEQYHEEKSEYRFHRKNCRYYDTIHREGKGALTKSGIGLIWSGFRPSDDGCTYGYLIPSNMFAVVVLGYLEELIDAVPGDHEKLKLRAKAIRNTVQQAIETHGIANLGDGEFAYAYETDGYGQYLMIDDANVPNLLSMKYLGYEPANKEAAARTRKWILSDENPYYYKGIMAAGMGSQHTKAGYVWPIGLVMQGLTSENKEEKWQILQTLARTTDGTMNMHESFDVDDASKYSRPWFSWANSMYCTLMLDYLDIK